MSDYRLRVLQTFLKLKAYNPFAGPDKRYGGGQRKKKKGQK